MTPFRIAVISQKGGTGKTTTAINLAVAAKDAGKRVLVADLDPQASATQWFRLRAPDATTSLVVQPTHSAGLRELESVAAAQGVDWMLLDTAAGTDVTASRAVESADLVLVTCRPSMFDRDATANSVRLCRVLGRLPHILLTQTDPQGPETAEVRAALASVGLDVLGCEIGRRKAFARSVKVGEGVLEYEPVGKAGDEIRGLFELLCRGRDKIARCEDTKMSAASASDGSEGR